MNVRRELEELARRSLSDDPQIALAACTRLQNAELPWLRQRGVALARRAGWSWSKIGRVLHMSRQATRKAFAHVDHQLPRRVEEPTWGNGTDRWIAAWNRDQRLTAELRDWEASGIDIVPW